MFRHSRHTFLDDRVGTRLDDSGVVTSEAVIVMVVFASMAIFLLMLLESEHVKQRIVDLVDDALSLAG